MADDLVRARFKGVEKNVGRSFAESTEGIEILDEPVAFGDGRLRPETRVSGRPKSRTSVAEIATEKKKAAAVAATDTAKEA